MDYVELSAIAISGLDRAQATLEQTAGLLARKGAPASDNFPGDSVDLSAAAVNMLVARQNFAVQVKVLKVADTIERNALDLIA